MPKESRVVMGESGRQKIVGDSTVLRQAPYLEQIVYGQGSPEGTIPGHTGNLYIDDAAVPPTMYIKGQGAPDSLTPWFAINTENVDTDSWGVVTDNGDHTFTFTPPLGSPAVTWDEGRSSGETVINRGADPTGATDSTAAFQTAWNEYGTLIVPPGDYRIDGTIRMYSWQSLILQRGATLTRLAADSASTDPILWLSGREALLAGPGAITFENASPYGVVAFGTAPWVPDLTLINSVFNTVQDLVITGDGASGSYCFYAHSDSTTGLGVSYYNVLRNNKVFDFGSGIYSWREFNLNTMISNYFYGIRDYIYDYPNVLTVENMHLGDGAASSPNLQAIINCDGVFNQWQGSCYETGGVASKSAIFGANSIGNKVDGIFNVAGGWTDDGSQNTVSIGLRWGFPALELNVPGGNNLTDMEGGIAIGEVTTVPTTNPFGSVALYNQGDDLKYRMPSGEVRALVGAVDSLGPFVADNMAASLSGQEMFIAAADNNTTRWVLPRGGSVTGLSARVGSAIVTGELLLTVKINGVVDSGLIVSFVSGVLVAWDTQAGALATFDAGDSLTLEWETNGTWGPATNSLRAFLEVTYDAL